MSLGVVPLSLGVGLIAALGILAWPERFGRRRLAILPGSTRSVAVPSSFLGWTWERARQWRPGRRTVALRTTDLLALLEAIAPALEAGMDSASALRIAADVRSVPGHPDPLGALAAEMASAAADGALLGPLWRAAAQSAGSAELLILAQAWSLTEDMGAPLAQAVRTTAGLLEARIAHERRLVAAVAGARATVNLLTVLPIGGPLMALVLGIEPDELYAGSRLSQCSLVLGLCLAGLGRLWVHRMVRAVARGPVIA